MTTIYQMTLTATTTEGSDAFRRALAGYNKTAKQGVVRNAKFALAKRMGFKERLYRLSEVPFVVAIETEFSGVSEKAFGGRSNFDWWKSNMQEKLIEMEKAEKITKEDYTVEFEEL